AVGLALASKHSAVLVFPMLVILAGIEVLRRKSVDVAQLSIGKRAARLAGALLVIGLVSVGILWGTYGFRYSARGNGLKLNPSMEAQLNQVPSPTEARVL